MRREIRTRRGREPRYVLFHTAHYSLAGANIAMSPETSHQSKQAEKR